MAAHDSDPNADCLLFFLPHEVLFHILKRLDARDLANLSRTCHEMYGIANDFELWREKCRHDFRLPIHRVNDQAADETFWKRLYRHVSTSRVYECGRVAPAQSVAVPRPVQGLERVGVRAVSCGGLHVGFLAFSGRVYMRGMGRVGQLGLGNWESRLSAQRVRALRDEHVVQVACGGLHTLFLTARGEVFSCGRGWDGALGLGEQRRRVQIDSVCVPRRIDALAGVERVRSIACGGRHSACVTDRGQLYTWGSARMGQLGHGEIERFRAVPTLVPAFVEDEVASTGRVVQVDCSSASTIVLTRENHVFFFGVNSEGPGRPQPRPQRVYEFDAMDVVRVVAGGLNFAVLTRDGRAYTWGTLNHYGQLGHGNLRPYAEPRPLAALDGQPVRSIAMSGTHAAVLTGDDRVLMIGSNDSKKLGIAALHTYEEARPIRDADVMRTDEVTPLHADVDEYFVPVPMPMCLPWVGSSVEGSASTAAARFTPVQVDLGGDFSMVLCMDGSEDMGAALDALLATRSE